MARFTIWTNTKGDNVHFYIIGTFSGETEAEALDNAARDPGDFNKKDVIVDPVTNKVKIIPFDNFEDRNNALGFTRDNYKVKKLDDQV